MFDAHAVVLSPIEALFLNLSLLCIVAYVDCWEVSQARKRPRYASPTRPFRYIRKDFSRTSTQHPTRNRRSFSSELTTSIKVSSLASVVAISSNLVLGHGIWTLYQALAWSLVGITGSSLSRIFRNGNAISIRREPLPLLQALHLTGWSRPVPFTPYPWRASQFT